MQKRTKKNKKNYSDRLVTKKQTPEPESRSNNILKYEKQLQLKNTIIQIWIQRQKLKLIGAIQSSTRVWFENLKKENERPKRWNQSRAATKKQK